MEENSLSVDELASRGTSTHQAGDTVREVVLVAVPSVEIGRNRSSPPNPYDFDFAHELRATYFHDGEKTSVQFPRWSNEYTQVDFKAPLSDVVFDNGNLHGVYRKEDDEKLCITWDIAEDEWELTTTEIDGEYEDEIAKMGDVVWSAVRSREVVTA